MSGGKNCRIHWFRTQQLINNLKSETILSECWRYDPKSRCVWQATCWETVSPRCTIIYDVFEVPPPLACWECCAAQKHLFSVCVRQVCVLLPTWNHSSHSAAQVPQQLSSDGSAGRCATHWPTVVSTTICIFASIEQHYGVCLTISSNTHTQHSQNSWFPKNMWPFLWAGCGIPAGTTHAGNVSPDAAEMRPTWAACVVRQPAWVSYSRWGVKGHCRCCLDMSKHQLCRQHLLDCLQPQKNQRPSAAPPCTLQGPRTTCWWPWL